MAERQWLRAKTVTIAVTTVTGLCVLLLVIKRLLGNDTPLLQDTEPALVGNAIFCALWYVWYFPKFKLLIDSLVRRGTISVAEDSDPAIEYYQRSTVTPGLILFFVGATLSVVSFRNGVGDDWFGAIVRTELAGAIGWLLWLSISGALAARRLFTKVPIVIELLDADGHGGLTPIGYFAIASMPPAISTMVMIALWNTPGGKLDPGFLAILIIAAFFTLFIGGFALLAPILACHRLLASVRDVENGKILKFVRQYRTDLESSLGEPDFGRASVTQQRLEVAMRLQKDVQQSSTWPLGLASVLTAPLAQVSAVVAAVTKIYSLLPPSAKHIHNISQFTKGG